MNPQLSKFFYFDRFLRRVLVKGSKVGAFSFLGNLLDFDFVEYSAVSITLSDQFSVMGVCRRLELLVRLGNLLDFGTCEW